ncbi:hypothetical protein ABZ249_08185 [Nocardiopsis sp. NPDC006139]|uniref:hypothetical protein n=1 Tax=Nocardiopsis sp. NPDC006139 TaxID=3154578 RepID=UPI0033A72AD0
MPDPLLPGDPARIGPYTLHARLGGGGMGRVSLGRSPGGRTVAVKVVRPDLAQDSEFRRRFATEVAAARKVGGFYTAQVVDADTSATPPWLATAYIPGPPCTGPSPTTAPTTWFSRSSARAPGAQHPPSRGPGRGPGSHPRVRRRASDGLHVLVATETVYASDGAVRSEAASRWRHRTGS